MKRTLTITTARAENYGAVLQAYALQKTIQKFGGENELIFLKNEKPEFWESIKGYSLRTKCIKILENIFRLYRYNELKNRFNKFLDFSENTLVHTKEITKLDELDLENYNALITGSDQVFGFSVDSNITNNRYLVCEKNIKKYSFAGSFSTYGLTELQEKFMKEQLKKYQKISVREGQGKKFLEDKLGLEAEVNIDPVFNFTKEEWEEMIDTKKIISKKYILCYFLISSPILESVISEVKKKYNLPVVAIQLTAIKRIKVDNYVFNAGPLDFLNLIKNAEAVVTTSFHGTAFSVIFEKDFYSVLKPGYRTERFTSLLNKLNINDRIINSKDYTLIEKIDYKSVNEKLKVEREKNLDYIKEFLK